MRVWAAVPYATSAGSCRSGRSASVFQTSVSCTRNATFDARSWDCMYLRHKNTHSLFIENRRCVFGGKKAPAGAPLVAPSLESTCFMSLRHKHQDSLFSRNIISYLEKTFKFAYRLKSDLKSLLTRFSDGKCKNKFSISSTQDFDSKLSILPWGDLQF